MALLARDHEGCLSDLELDRLRLGELAGEARAEAERHLEGCPGCATRAKALDNEALAYPSTIPLGALAQEASRRARRSWAPRLAMAGGGLALAAALVLVVLEPTSAPGVDRLKGGEALELIARRQDGTVSLLAPGAVLHPGEQLRFRLSTRQASHLVLVGLDAAGQVTPYFPLEGDARPLPSGDAQLLEGSIVLDDTLGPERVVAVLCEQPVQVRRVLEAGRHALAEAGGDPTRVGRLPLDCRQTSQLFHKRAAR